MSGTRGSGKGGGHNKGQTMPYTVLRTWDGGMFGARSAADFIAERRTP